jgi:hypothetical protein
MKILPLALAALTLAAPAVAQDAATQPAASPAPAPAADKKICRAVQSTGSIMAKRTCHLRSEWVQIDQTNAAAAQSALGRNNRTGK